MFVKFVAALQCILSGNLKRKYLDSVMGLSYISAALSEILQF